MFFSVLAVLQGMTDDSPEICICLSNLFQKVPDNLTFDKTNIRAG